MNKAEVCPAVASVVDIEMEKLDPGIEMEEKSDPVAIVVYVRSRFETNATGAAATVHTPPLICLQRSDSLKN